MTAYQLVLPLGHKLLPHVQREEEGPAPTILDLFTTASIVYGSPGVVGKATDCFAVLGPDEHEGVLLVVALLVEGLGAEAVLGGPKQSLHLLYFFLFQDSVEYFSILTL